MRALPSNDLYDVAIYLMMTQASIYEEQHKAMESVKTGIADKVWEYENGMPAITRWMAPADANPPSSKP